MTYILAAIAVCCFASMTLVIVASARALERQERKYGRLLAKHVAVREQVPEIPDFVNSAGERYSRRVKDIEGLRVQHRNAKGREE